MKFFLSADSHETTRGGGGVLISGVIVFEGSCLILDLVSDRADFGEGGTHIWDKYTLGESL